MAELVVLTGPPGAGKSTVAALVSARLPGSALVPGDDFYGFLGSHVVPPWRPEAHAQNEVVTAVAAAAAGRFVTGGYDVVYDGVVGPWLLPTFLSGAGVRLVHYLVLLPDEDTCLARVRRRVGHGFTDESACRRMHADFAGAGIAGRHVVPTDGDAETVAAAVVATVRAGTAAVSA